MGNPIDRMARIVIEPSGRARWGVILREGATRVGRAPDLEIRIEDDSVGGVHCELLVLGRLVFVRDLGRGCETRVDDIRVVGTTQVRNGQVIRMGNVQARIEADSIAPDPLTDVASRSALASQARRPLDDPSQEKRHGEKPPMSFPDPSSAGAVDCCRAMLRSWQALISTCGHWMNRRHRVSKTSWRSTLFSAGIALVIITLMAYRLRGRA